jgi:organic radical activating enzyme
MVKDVHSEVRGPLEGVHLLLTYKCIYECDHCFIWGSPRAVGTMSSKQVAEILRQASQIESVKRVYFEGGEPFLFYPVLLEGVRLAKKQGFEIGIVSNAYWATEPQDADMWLRPLSQIGVEDLSISADEHHGSAEEARNARTAIAAARRLRMPSQLMKVKDIEFYSCHSSSKADEGDLMFRGRAAVELAPKVGKKPWRSFDSCGEEPPKIGRVHVDAFGNVQFCQGITVGNLWKKPLKKIMEDLDPEKHPVIGPLIRGGPSNLSRELEIRPKRGYADGCHLCYEIRCAARKRGMLPGVLRPDQAYGVMPE